jgi:hypothetical protein
MAGVNEWCGILETKKITVLQHLIVNKEKNQL